MMRPLEQWICDRCGGLIANVKEGWLEWIREDDKAGDFKIVHHASASPRHPDGDCYHHSRQRGRQDNHLEYYVGPDGIPKLLSFLDIGPYHDPDGRHIVGVSDIRELVELMRRLTIPYYEEALLYWSRAEADGYFEGANEVWLYLPDTLKTLIERYSDED